MSDLSGQFPPAKCPCCAGQGFTCVHIYSDRPEGETKFPLSEGSYHRELWLCDLCGHYLSTHGMDLSALYDADYIDSTYGGLDGVRRTYEKIMNLPPEKSDNVARVNRVIDFANRHFPDATKLRVLDIGSGLGVFLGRVSQQTEWICTALEPDPRFAQHTRETLGIEAIAEDYLKTDWERQWDLITLNKVLEHVEEPMVMLCKVIRDLTPGGVLYLELPDGEGAASDPDGFGREEFFIEHHHVFSMASMELLTRQAGLRSIELERLREPSTKYTLRSFLTPAN